VGIQGRGGRLITLDARPIKLPLNGKDLERLIGLRQFLAIMRKYGAIFARKSP
jgi:hypothetical protein